MLRWWPIGRPLWPLRRPHLLLTGRWPSTPAPTPTPTPATVYVTVNSARIVQAEGKINLRDITFSGGISASIVVKLFDVETETQIGTDKTAGPGTSLTIGPTDIGSAVIVAFRYTATTDAEGYENRTTLTTMTTVVIVGDSDLQAFVPAAQVP